MILIEDADAGGSLAFQTQEVYAEGIFCPHVLRANAPSALLALTLLGSVEYEPYLIAFGADVHIDMRVIICERT